MLARGVRDHVGMWYKCIRCCDTVRSRLTRGFNELLRHLVYRKLRVNYRMLRVILIASVLCLNLGVLYSWRNIGDKTLANSSSAEKVEQTVDDQELQNLQYLLETGYAHGNKRVIQRRRMIGTDDIKFGCRKNITAAAERNDNRRRVIDSVCRKYNQDDVVMKSPILSSAYVYREKSLVYCINAKAGCTYWKNLLRFAAGDYEGAVYTPNEIPREYTHFGPLNTIEEYPKLNSDVLSMLAPGLSFTFAREPYSRLWSAYLDKLFLPDFWPWYGTRIVRKLRTNPETASSTCGHDVTFSEFLEDLIELQEPWELNEHFAPTFRSCNPCQMRFDIIGKMETFKTDTDLIKFSAGIHVPESSAADRTMGEVRMLVDYNYDILNRLVRKSGNAKCYDNMVVAMRLWKTFQFNGYLGEYIEFPENVLKQITDKEDIKTELIKLIQHHRNSAGDDVIRWKGQRTAFMHNAYNNVPINIIGAIQDKFSLDFEFFEYNKYPGFLPNS